MAPTTKQSSKPVFKTATPFTETKWPQITHNDQEVILDLTCNLIAPLGDHRRTHIHPSKGKKRKRPSNPTQDEVPMDDAPPPPPEIGKHMLIGLNSITRHLEALAAKKAPPTAITAPVEEDGDPGEAENLRLLSLVLLTHPKPSLSPAHAHIPTLLHLSNLPSTPSQSTPPTHPSLNTSTRLIPLPTSSDARLASKLHIPRVSALAIFEGAPGTKALVEYVRQHVDVTECVWVDEAMKGEWRGACVKMEMSGSGGGK